MTLQDSVTLIMCTFLRSNDIAIKARYGDESLGETTFFRIGVITPSDSFVFTLEAEVKSRGGGGGGGGTSISD